MRQSNPKNVTNILREHNLRIKKKFGQNFLIDDNVLDKIIDTSEITKDDFVIEIGPGLGSLTERLISSANKVLAYEIDTDLIPVLQAAFKDERFHLIEADILKRDIDKDIAAIDPKIDAVTVVANLPYYITTPILMKCLETSKKIKRVVVMMQYEVAKRITASTHTKDYNALSIAVQYRAKTHFAFKVPKNVFIPAPNVDSAIITLDFHDKYQGEVLSEAFFFSFIKAAFSQRRKTLVNNLYASLNIEKSDVLDVLEDLKINAQARAETISLEQFIKLSNHFYQTKFIEK